MSIGLRRARGRHDAVEVAGIADRPLKRLLRAHRETDHGAQMLDVQLLHEQRVHGLDVVADRDGRKMRAVKRRRCVAGRGRTAVAEQFAGDQEHLARVERLARTDQPTVAVHVRHVVRRQQDGVIPRGVQLAVGAVHDVRLGQHRAALRLEVLDQEFMAHRLGLGTGVFRVRERGDEQRGDQRGAPHADSRFTWHGYFLNIVTAAASVCYMQPR